VPTGAAVGTAKAGPWADNLVRPTFDRLGRPSIEISIDGGGEPPWRLTFSFLNDLYAIMEAAWQANGADSQISSST
jgi:hypothetical protein